MLKLIIPDAEIEIDTSSLFNLFKNLFKKSLETTQKKNYDPNVYDKPLVESILKEVKKNKK